jgi:SAM-dependent methyltransferase
LLEKIYKFRIVRMLVPRFIKNIRRGFKVRLNAERFGIEQFLQAASIDIQPSSRLLNAGAGEGQYKAFFESCRYESTDITTGFSSADHRLSYLSDLHHMPIQDNTYDVIVNNQVLEHVEFPQRVINEFYRVLRPGGQLILTAPQAWGIHMAPHHYYNFTRYGLESLFNNADLEIKSISPLGGVFWNLAKIISKLPKSIIGEYRCPKKTKALILLYPFYLFFKPLCEYVIPFIFFYLDRIDTNQRWTIGYACHCQKRAIT